MISNLFGMRGVSCRFLTMLLFGSLLMVAVGCEDTLVAVPFDDSVVDDYTKPGETLGEQTLFEQEEHEEETPKDVGRTAVTDPLGSCVDNCGGKSSDCWCDIHCNLYGDCCNDVCDLCSLAGYCWPDHPDYETDTDVRDDVIVPVPYADSGDAGERELINYGPFEVLQGESLRVRLYHAGTGSEATYLYFKLGGPVDSINGMSTPTGQFQLYDRYTLVWMPGNAQLTQYWVAVRGGGQPVNPYAIDICRDDDRDDVCNSEDLCLGNDMFGDEDNDGVCEDIDACRGDDALGDSDGDGSCDDTDLCTGDDRYGDRDGNGTCEDIDGCSDTDAGDSDGDGVCDPDDLCPGTDAIDRDLDGICDDRDNCLGQPYADRDYDGCCDDGDICPLDGENDADGDGLCADVDLCLGWNYTGDSDGDGVCDDRDVCVGDDATGCVEQATCDDLAGTDWGSCAPSPLGAAVINGTCQMIFGCEVPAGIVLFSSAAECEENCDGCSDNSQCAGNEYCKFPADDTCGTFSFGVCAPRAEVCSAIYDPVCGCDNQIYSSYCYADLRGMNVAYYGECTSWAHGCTPRPRTVPWDPKTW